MVVMKVANSEEKMSGTMKCHSCVQNSSSTPGTLYYKRKQLRPPSTHREPHTQSQQNVDFFFSFSPSHNVYSFPLMHGQHEHIARLSVYLSYSICTQFFKGTRLVGSDRQRNQMQNTMNRVKKGYLIENSQLKMLTF